MPCRLQAVNSARTSWQIQEQARGRACSFFALSMTRLCAYFRLGL